MLGAWYRAAVVPTVQVGGGALPPTTGDSQHRCVAHTPHTSPCRRSQCGVLPPTELQVPHYFSMLVIFPFRSLQVRTPMDLATILARVDGKQYGTTAQYLADVALIVQVGDPRGGLLSFA